MKALKYKILARLQDEHSGFSRNRHYHALSEPPGRHAHRIHKHLRALEHDLIRALQVGPPDEVLAVTWVGRDAARDAATVPAAEPGMYRVEVRLHILKSTRVAWLTREEFAILCASPRVGAALVGAAPCVPDAP
jgi:hypothetical protein